MKKLIKAILRKIKRLYVCCYRTVVMRPIVWLKCRESVSINDFKVDTAFTYQPDSYYPAIMRDNVRRAKRVLARQTVPDANGLPTTPSGPTLYRPVNIVQFGLMSYNFHLRFGEDKYKNDLLAVCTWLCDNIGEDGTWSHDYPKRSNAVNAVMSAGWSSGMVQGEGISCLVRGYFLTKNPVYLDVAERALAPFDRSWNEGGVRRMLGEGLPMYEKYPTDPASCILNGFLFALVGLYDLGQTDHSGAERARDLFEAGLNTLSHILPLFDDDLCSLYDLGYVFAVPMPKHKNPYYHWIHVNLLVAINSVQPSPVYRHFIAKWK